MHRHNQVCLLGKDRLRMLSGRTQVAHLAELDRDRTRWQEGCNLRVQECPIHSDKVRLVWDKVRGRILLAHRDSERLALGLRLRVRTVPLHRARSGKPLEECRSVNSLNRTRTNRSSLARLANHLGSSSNNRAEGV